MRTLYLVFQFALFFLAGKAQVITGKVTDAGTKEPLPYVHIGVLNRNMGVISREDGSFEINLASAKSEDELMFSILGYELKKINVKDLKESILIVNMIPKTYKLREVVIRPGKITDPVKLGRFNPSAITTGHSGSQAFGFGGEWGLKVFVDGKKYKILDARFHLRFNTIDSILFRVQIYSIKDGMPDESLLKKEAYAKSRRKAHWIICDLIPQELTLDRDVIVTYEVVRLWYNSKKDNQLFFTHGSGYDRGGRISRASSHDQWRSNDSPPVVLYLSGEEIN